MNTNRTVKLLNTVYRRQFVLTHYLSHTFNNSCSGTSPTMVDSKKDSDANVVWKRQDSHGCQGFTQTKSGCCQGFTQTKKGYLQKRTSDFSSISPTAPQVTLRVILTLTAMVGFKSWNLDATCVFISVPLPQGQKMYLKPIERYPLPKDKVLKVFKTIYGLIQAS